MIGRLLVTLSAVLASCALLAAQGTGAPPQTPPPPPPQGPQQTPVFRVRVDSISVDVAVTDRQGRPVADLKAEDFEIRESGKTQTIESFRFIRTDEDLGAAGPEQARQILSAADMARETANPENRVILIFLDDYHTRASNALYIRQILAKFVGNLTSRDLVALAYPLNTVAAVTFSRNHDGTAAAIMNFHGRKYDYRPTTAYEEYFAQYPPEMQEQIRNDITIRTLQSACSLLATLRDGRKMLLYVSEGMTAYIPAGARTSGTMFPPRTIAPPTTGAQESSEFFRSADLLGRMRDIFAVATRGNTSIWALDPRGLATSEYGAGDLVNPTSDRRILQEATDSLRVMADETDGRAIIGKNDPMPDLQRMVKELSAYYLLGYTSTLAPRDGRFHEIQVKVNRKDVEVRHRKGYWAYSEEEIRRASEPPKAGPPAEINEALDALATLVEPASRHDVILWVGAVRGEAERAQVTVVWEVPPGIVASSADRVDRVSLTATSGTDVVFRGTVERDPAALRPSGRVTFAAPAGPIRLRIASENTQGQKLNTEDVTDLIPDFTSPAVAITAPQVFRGRSAYDIGVLRKSTTAMPSATRRFSRTERLLIRFEAYGPGGVNPQVSMRVLSREGKELAALPSPANTAGTTFEADVSLAPFPPGDYVIEINAASGPEKVVRLIGIRVTG